MCSTTIIMLLLIIFVSYLFLLGKHTNVRAGRDNAAEGFSTRPGHFLRVDSQTTGNNSEKS